MNTKQLLKGANAKDKTMMVMVIAVLDYISISDFVCVSVFASMCESGDKHLHKNDVSSTFSAPQGEPGNVGSPGLRGEKVSNIKRTREY